MSSDGLSLLGYGFLAAILIAIAVTLLLVNSVSLPYPGAALLIAVIVIPIYWLARPKSATGSATSAPVDQVA